VLFDKSGLEIKLDGRELPQTLRVEQVHLACTNA